MKEIKWSAPEFDYRPKELGWYWGVVIVAIILTAAALWQKNLLFAIFTVIAAVMVFIWGRQRPKIVRYELDEKALVIKGNRYYLDNFSGFYVDSGLLVLKFKSRFRPYMKLPIDEADAQLIAQILKNKLKGIEYKESLTDAIGKLLGF